MISYKTVFQYGQDTHMQSLSKKSDMKIFRYGNFIEWFFSENQVVKIVICNTVILIKQNSDVYVNFPDPSDLHELRGSVSLSVLFQKMICHKNHSCSICQLHELYECVSSKHLLKKMIYIPIYLHCFHFSNHFRYFTWYKNPLNEAETEENPCHLVGFNLKQACFNLKNRCVLLRECSQFNSSCITCQVRYGAKAFTYFLSYHLQTITIISAVRHSS